MASVKVKQDDLRRLMKEKRENLQNKKNRVDSPFAKYNSLGQLSCIICNVQVKSNALWTSHVTGKIHKENALKKRKRTADNTSDGLSNSNEKKPEQQTPVFKKPKTIDINESPTSKVETEKSMANLSLMEVYSSSSEDEDESVSEKSASNTDPNNVLPADFFDAAPAPFQVNQEKNVEGAKTPASVPTNSVEALPEGFFDDPVLDAKARNIEYKDPVEEEWERYQKAIAEETNVSKTIIEEDFEESTLERDISEIDLQINLWGKAKTLQTIAEEARSNVPLNGDEMEASSNTDEELEEDDLLDWRSKGVKKK